MSAETLIEEARKLSVAERIRIAEELWDSVSADQANDPLTPEQRAELDLRIAEYEVDPKAGSDWQDVRARLERKL